MSAKNIAKPKGCKFPLSVAELRTIIIIRYKTYFVIFIAISFFFATSIKKYYHKLCVVF